MTIIDETSGLVFKKFPTICTYFEIDSNENIVFCNCDSAEAEFFDLNGKILKNISFTKFDDFETGDAFLGKEDGSLFFYDWHTSLFYFD